MKINVNTIDILIAKFQRTLKAINNTKQEIAGAKEIKYFLETDSVSLYTSKLLPKDMINSVNEIEKAITDDLNELSKDIEL